MLARRLIPTLLAAAAVAAPLTAHARPWTLSDGNTTKFIDDVRISPDGAHALIDVASADAKTRRVPNLSANQPLTGMNTATAST